MIAERSASSQGGMPNLNMVRPALAGRRQGRGSGIPVVALDARELDQVVERVAAEEARPVRDGRVVVRLEAGIGQPPARAVEVIDVEAEVAGGAGRQVAAEEVELHAVPGGVP